MNASLPDWLCFFPEANVQSLGPLLAEKNAWVSQEREGFLRYRRPLEAVRHIRARRLDFTEDAVLIGGEGELAPEERLQVRNTLEAFIPWRKGPFSIFGIDVDAEWRSERKWARLLPELPDLRGKIVADIGCNNGYYMFRMAAQAPAFVLGFEPFVQHHFAFRLLNGFAGRQELRSELLGAEHLGLFPRSFDVIFCLGILYHRPSPVMALKNLFQALKPGGTLLVESQAIPGDEPVALFPEKTYAKAPGTWFVPTAACLKNWLSRTGFSAVRLFCQHPMSGAEQRRTEWMKFESYEDFIDKNNPFRTIEGYPAPLRVYVRASKS